MDFSFRLFFTLLYGIVNCKEYFRGYNVDRIFVNSSQNIIKFKHWVEKFDIMKWLADLKKNYESLVDLEEIGQSFEKRPILVVKIGKSARNHVKPAVWIDAGIHSREWLSVATALYVINEFMVQYSRNESSIVNLIDRVDFHIAPVINPDGYEYSRSMRDMALLAIDALQGVHGTPYSFGTVSDLLYPASGTSVDFAHSLNITYAYAIELRPGETGVVRQNPFRGFMQQESQIEPTGQETFAAFAALTEAILNES